MARRKAMSIRTPTGKEVKVDPEQAIEAYQRIRAGSTKGSTRTRQLIEEGRKYEQEHSRGPRGGRGMQRNEE